MKILTTKDVADILKMHEVTVRNKCRNKELPCFKIGNHWKIKEDELFKWIDEQQVKNA